MKKLFYPAILFCLFTFTNSSVFSQPFSLVKDINRGSFNLCLGSGKQPLNMIEVNGILFFSVHSSSTFTSNGLWKTDGTQVGTVLVKQMSAIEKMINTNGIVYFISSSTGELWKSDGTEAGTVLVKVLPGGGVTKNLTGVNGSVYFTIGEDLWKSDGTGAGTEKVKTFKSPGNLVNVNGTLFLTSYFRSPDTNGTPFRQTLWKSDGTQAGTVMVKDITSPIGEPSLLELTSSTGGLYFVMKPATDAAELWKSDGSDAGTQKIMGAEPGFTISSISNLTEVNGSLNFFANTSSLGNTLWQTNGTPEGTFILKDLDNNTAYSNLVRNGNGLNFSGYNSSTGGEIWKSDGTLAGTVIVKNLGVASGTPQNLIGANGTLFFTISDDGLHPELSYPCFTDQGSLWKSDGTAAGTSLLKDVFIGMKSDDPQKFVSVGGKIFFSASNGLNGMEVWKSDGTVAGTSMVKDILTTTGSSPAKFTSLNGRVYFIAMDSESGPAFGKGREVHQTDGTLAGTFQSTWIFTLGGSYPKEIISHNGSLFLSATDGARGYELFITNGLGLVPSSNTTMVKDINPTMGIGERSSNPSNFTSVNSTLFFSANDGTNGNELWKTDGTNAGTIMVKNINAGSNNSNPSNLINADGVLYFTADNGIDGIELWKSDGTDAGTVMIKNINPGSNNANPVYLTAVNGMVYFSADNGNNGIELWKTDGTEAGTTLVKDINPGIDNSNPSSLTNVNGVLYFAADDGIHGIEVWKSNGTETETELIKDIQPGNIGSNPVYFTGVNGMVYFSADDGTVGRELWRSNGTMTGTILIKDIQAGPAGSSPSVLTKVGTNLLFAADDGFHGSEIWLSNGSDQGTRLMYDIEPGIAGSNPTELFEFGGKVLAAATNLLFGAELWIADAPADSPLPLTLLEFKGQLVNNDGILEWKTDNELNTEAFIIERSVDGRNYTAIGSVASASAVGVHYYNYTDQNVLALEASHIYYRLKQTDIDGKFTYSNIVILSVTSGKNFVLLYPNPVKDNINMTINVSQKEKMQWQLTDNMGRKIKAGSYDLSPGSMTVSIDITSLSSGMYLIQLNSASLQKVIKVMKR